MYIQEISIEAKSAKSLEYIIDQFELLMSFYRGAGQTQGRLESQYIDGTKLFALPYTLEEDSLSSVYNNLYVNKQIAALEELCVSKFQFRTVGKTHCGYVGACKCLRSDFYILITNYLSIDSPLTCGTCNKSVPLYRLPVYDDHGYKPILRWESNYISCDRLFMNGDVGERWALGQMQEIGSQLTEQGRSICSRVEELSSVPTYYYLHNYRRERLKKPARKCSGCGVEWVLKEQLNGFYDFKCDHCKLVSVFSPNSG